MADSDNIKLWLILIQIDGNTNTDKTLNLGDVILHKSGKNID